MRVNINNSKYVKGITLMKNIFNHLHSEEILNRIDKLNPNSQPQWGRMDVAQMLAHCSSYQDIAMGKSFPPRSWIGRLIGRFVKPLLYNDKPIPHNMSTITEMLITDKREFDTEREKLKQKIMAFQNDGPEKCTLIHILFLVKSAPRNGGKEFISTSIII